MKYLRPFLLCILILVVTAPSMAQVPRAAFTEMGSATW
jgi:hypothetical protein